MNVMILVLHAGRSVCEVTLSKFSQPLVMNIAFVWNFSGDEDDDRIPEVDALTGEILADRDHVAIFPASHFVTREEKMLKAIDNIEQELEQRLALLRAEDRLLEAQRLEQRTRYDLEMMREMGFFVSGIENYSRHLTLREAGATPYTLLDYFPEDFLLIVDESHVTLPQVRGMYNRGQEHEKGY
ncbi:UvrABC system protein B OS=Lysinibacillus sphaericus OX=1421 GN=uvrB PE=3 SV=1 [Lysinibacillus sphaericus]